MLKKIIFLILVIGLLAGCQATKQASTTEQTPTQQPLDNLGVEEVSKLNSELASPENIEAGLDQVNW